MSETTYKLSIFNYIVTKDKERVLVYNTYADIEQLMINNTEWNTDRVIDECKDCKLLPICMNNCHTNHNIHKHECNYKLLCKMIYNRTTK